MLTPVTLIVAVAPAFVVGVPLSLKVTVGALVNPEPGAPGVITATLMVAMAATGAPAPPFESAIPIAGADV
jgi:hypothetical protein